MTPDPDSLSAGEPSDPHPSWSEDPVEEWMAGCLALPPEERSSAIDRLCQEHPDQSKEIRERLFALEAIGIDFSRAPCDPLPERLGEFRLLRLLGSGGMGAVYLAHQESMGRDVALKLIRPEHLYFPGARERFHREVQAVAKLQHPGIVPIHTVGEENGIPYFVMERVQGCSLAEVIAHFKERPVRDLTGRDLAQGVRELVQARHGIEVDEKDQDFGQGSWVDAVISLIVQVGDALEHAHRLGVLHRDIKPSNIVVTAKGRAMILDFGLASTSDDETITKTGAILGSIAYMSPEQVRGEVRDLDEGSDVYSLGVTLYELLTLRSPFPGDGSQVVRRHILEGRPRPPHLINPSVSNDANVVCLTAMEPDRKRRYTSAALLAADLRNVLARRPIFAQPPGAWVRIHRWIQRHPLTSALIGVNLVLATAAPIWSWISISRERDNAVRLSKDLAEQNRRLEESHHEIERLLAEQTLLYDRRLAKDLLEEEDSLYPAHPDTAERMAQWIQQCEGLQVRRQTDRPPPWSQEDNDHLAALETHLDEVRRRYSFATSVEEKTLDSPDASDAWSEALTRIEDSSLYGHEELEPQLGLIPLGADPRSGLEEFWHVESGTRPLRGDDDSWVLDESTGLVFVLIPQGEFWMGSEVARGAPRSEVPRHRVPLGSFFLAKYEMSQAQWIRATGKNPSAFVDLGHDDLLLRPIDSISWHEAQLQLHRLGLVLPTEAQWEYACRAGTTTEFAHGDDPNELRRYANLASSEMRRYGNRDTHDWADGFESTAPCGSFSPNAFGLHDMHGNIAEWCSDWLRLYVAARAKGDDGHREGDHFPERVTRGGAYIHRAPKTRCSARDSLAPSVRQMIIGVRPARRVER